jgi:VWFA-related protein
MKVKNRSWKIIINIMLLSILSGYHSNTQDSNLYKVSVDAVLVPAFVVDHKGNPVFDLRKEDFELIVNGVSTEITDLSSIPFYDHETISMGKKSTEHITPIPQVERFVFIILDNVFISHAGHRRAKSIAAGIIKNSLPNDIFVVMENNPAGGLRYIGGIENGKAPLIKKIKELEVRESSWSKTLFNMREWDPYADTDANDPREALSGNMVTLKNRKKAFDRDSYRQQAINFAESLKPLKHALKSVIKPKIVFLISEGIAKSAYISGLAHTDGSGVAILKDERTAQQINHAINPLYFQRIKEMVEAFNDGGSVLYTINPGKPKSDEGSSRDESLNFMAAEGGGRYFSGSKTEDIISNVRRSTAAYYEFAFMIDTSSDRYSGKLNIKIKCRKDGVIVHSFDKTERGKAYHEMSKVEKQLFGFDVVTGGNWSRMVGKIVRVRYKEKKSGNHKSLMVELPEKMRNRYLDIFLISYDQSDNKTNVKLTSQIITTEVLNIPVQYLSDSSHRNYFAIVEPENVFCIYNEIRR